MPNRNSPWPTTTAFAWYERAVDWLGRYAPDDHVLHSCQAKADACIGSAIAIREAERLEGTGGATTDFVFVVSRFGDTSGGVTADWVTSDGEAVAGVDYIPASGRLTFGGDVNCARSRQNRDAVGTSRVITMGRTGNCPQSAGLIHKATMENRT